MELMRQGNADFKVYILSSMPIVSGYIIDISKKGIQKWKFEKTNSDIVYSTKQNGRTRLEIHTCCLSDYLSIYHLLMYQHFLNVAPDQDSTTWEKINFFSPSPTILNFTEEILGRVKTRKKWNNWVWFQQRRWGNPQWWVLLCEEDPGWVEITDFEWYSASDVTD